MVVGGNARVKRGIVPPSFVGRDRSSSATRTAVIGRRRRRRQRLGLRSSPAHQNVVRGGFFTNAPIGLWLLFTASGTVSTASRGEHPASRDPRPLRRPPGDVTTTADDAAPFTRQRRTGARSAATTATPARRTSAVPPTARACGHGVTVCDDTNPCTTDTWQSGDRLRVHAGHRRRTVSGGRVHRRRVLVVVGR